MSETLGAVPLRAVGWLDHRDDKFVLAIGVFVAGMVVLTMAVGSSALTQVACLVALAAAVLSPMTGLVCFAFLAALKMPVVLPLPGFHALLVAAMVFGIVVRMPIERPRLALGAPLLAVAAFAVYVVVQQLPDMVTGYSGDLGHEVGFQIIQLLTGIVGTIAAAVVLQRRSPYPVIVALIGSACVAALLAIATFDSVPGGPLANLVANPDDDSARPSGAFGNPNYFGMFMASAIVLVVGLLIHTQDRRKRILLTGVLVLLGVAIVLSQSRAALLTLFAGLLVQAFLHSRRAGFWLLVAGVTAYFVVFPLYVQWRLTNLSGSASGLAYFATAQSDAVRFRALQAGPGIFLSSPVTGVGFAHYRSLAGIEAHNWYMTVAAELGIVGSILWGLVLLVVGRGVWRRKGIARSVGLGVLTVATVGSLFLEPPISIQVSVLSYLTLTAVLVSDWVGPWAGSVSRTVQRQQRRTPYPVTVA